MLASLAGTVPQWLTIVVIVAGAWVVWRGGGGTALSVLQDANRVLEQRVRELEHQGKLDARLIAELRGKTDLVSVVRPFMQWAQAHEARAQTRFEQTTHILEMVAARLGPEHTEGG